MTQYLITKRDRCGYCQGVQDGDFAEGSKCGYENCVDGYITVAVDLLDVLLECFAVSLGEPVKAKNILYQRLEQRDGEA